MEIGESTFEYHLDNEFFGMIGEEEIQKGDIKCKVTVTKNTKQCELDFELEGTVVVEIWVDRMGGVVRAIPGADGTTVTDNELWKAATQAALKTKFNVSPDSPEQMKGTITYIFKLK